MKKFIIGFILGSLLTGPLVWAAAKDIRISDNDGDVLEVTSAGAVTITF